MKKILYAAAAVFLIACGSDSNEDASSGTSTAGSTAATSDTDPADTLYKFVMKQHDDAMAKFGALKRNRAAADQKVDSLKKAKKNPAEYASLSKDLQSAEDNMNTWMHGFSIDSAQDGESAARIAYLTPEREKVVKVKDEIFSALAKADSLLKK